LDYSCFMLKPETLRCVGWFDEEFVGAYYEDNDYTARIVRAGERGVRVGAAPYYHYSMRTVNNNPETKPAIQRYAALNGDRFQQKWGRLPAGSPEEMRETYYKYPFNNSVCLQPDLHTRFQDMYNQTIADRGGHSMEEDPIYLLASTVGTATVVGDAGIGALTAIASSGVRQLVHAGSLERCAQERFDAAATIYALNYQRVEKNELPGEGDKGGLTVIADMAHLKVCDADAMVEAAGRYIIVCEVSAYPARAQFGDSDTWRAAAACLRRHHQFRLQSLNAAPGHWTPTGKKVLKVSWNCCCSPCSVTVTYSISN
jgi:hypothetical protein